MTAKNPARRLSFDDSMELDRNGGNEGSSSEEEDEEDEEEEAAESGETAISPEPKLIPLKQAEQPSPPSPKDAGAQGSGEASPARRALRGGATMKSETATSKRLKKPPPASQEEDEGGNSGDASPARGPLPDDTADAGHNKRAATSKRGKKRSPPPRQEEERPEKRAAGPDAETVAASVPRRKKKSKRSAEKDRRKRKKKKQLKKALLTKPTSPPKLLQFELNLNDTPSSPDTAQDDEHHGREMAEQEQSNTSPPLDEHRGRGEEQQEKNNTEQEHAGDTSSPHDKDMHTAHGEEHQEKQVANQEHNHIAHLHDKDMHSAHGEEQREKEAANQEHANDTSPQKDNHSADEEVQQGGHHSAHEEEQQGDITVLEQPSGTSPSREKNRVQEDEETGAQVNGKALQGRIAPSTKRGISEKEKKPAVERSWSYDDEFKILNALVAHAKSHNGDLPDSAHLLANLTFDKIDANEDKLNDKIRKLRTRYNKLLLQGCPSDNHSRRLFKLSESLWGHVDEDEHAEPTSRDFSVLSKLYPHLAKEVKAYAETHSSRDVIMAMFMTMGDEKARDLDAKCKKQQIEAFKLECEILSAFSSLTRVKF